MTITILDGGLGQELITRYDGEISGLWGAQVMIEAPELVEQVHTDYFNAGAQIATTNSYVLHRDRLAPYDMEHEFTRLNRLACEIAARSRDAHGSGMVAGSLGPTGRSYRPDLAPSEDEAASLFAEMAAIHAPFVDFFICETMSSVNQARGAVLGANTTNKPVWLSISVDDKEGSQLRSGEAVTDILPLIAELDVAALLVNCSVPEAVTKAITTLGKQSLPVGAYANGFKMITDEFKQGATVEALNKRIDLTPDAYAGFAQGWIDSGASLIGGCCEVGPAHISELARRFA